MKNRRPTEEQEIAVIGEYVTLGQLLKIANVIGSGGEAKLYLTETVVMVNGEPEPRRGRKLRPGDLVVAPDAPPIRLTGETDATTETQRHRGVTEEDEDSSTGFTG